MSVSQAVAQAHPPDDGGSDRQSSQLQQPGPSGSKAGRVEVAGRQLVGEVDVQPLAPSRAGTVAGRVLAVEHTVLTTDPRGVGRSPLDDPDGESTPELRADDLSRLLAHLDAGPAVVLGPSGGAVTALALAQAHPQHVST